MRYLCGFQGQSRKPTGNGLAVVIAWVCKLGVMGSDPTMVYQPTTTALEEPCLGAANRVKVVCQ